MTPQEEIELIVNTVYLRGCGSAYATAIAGMQESEKKRLTRHWLLIEDSGDVVAMSDSQFVAAASVYGCIDVLEAEGAVNRVIKEKERERLTELVKMIKEQSPS